MRRAEQERAGTRTPPKTRKQICKLLIFSGSYKSIAWHQTSYISIKTHLWQICRARTFRTSDGQKITDLD
jgi:hypothetical protein